MGYLAKELKRVSFFLQGIGLGVGGAVDFKFAGLNLDGLPFALTLDENAVDVTCRACGEGFELLVGEAVHVKNNLDVFYGASVVESHKLHIFVAAVGAHPSFDADLLPDKGCRIGEKFGYFNAFHFRQSL